MSHVVGVYDRVAPPNVSHRTLVVPVVPAITEVVVVAAQRTEKEHRQPYHPIAMVAVSSRKRVHLMTAAIRLTMMNVVIQVVYVVHAVPPNVRVSHVHNPDGDMALHKLW